MLLLYFMALKHFPPFFSGNGLSNFYNCLVFLSRIVQLPEGGDIIHITSSHASDSGHYSCLASNKYGEERTSAGITITVENGGGATADQTSWTIFVGPEDMDAISGDSVILECLTWKMDNNEVTWRRTGKECNIYCLLVIKPVLHYHDLGPNQGRW